MKNTSEIQENFSNINIYTQWFKNKRVIQMKQK